jgi:hypothetical protein
MRAGSGRLRKNGVHFKMEPCAARPIVGAAGLAERPLQSKNRNREKCGAKDMRRCPFAPSIGGAAAARRRPGRAGRIEACRAAGQNSTLIDPLK